MLRRSLECCWNNENISQPPTWKMEKCHRMKKEKQKLTWHVKITFNISPSPFLAGLSYFSEFTDVYLSWSKFGLLVESLSEPFMINFTTCSSSKMFWHSMKTSNRPKTNKQQPKLARNSLVMKSSSQQRWASNSQLATMERLTWFWENIWHDLRKLPEVENVSQTKRSVNISMREFVKLDFMTCQTRNV